MSIRPEKSIISPGIRVNTDRILNIIALMSTIARSPPILNFINARAIRPETVVRQLEDISGIALLRAVIHASRLSICSCSSLYRWIRIIA